MSVTIQQYILRFEVTIDDLPCSGGIGKDFVRGRECRERVRLRLMDERWLEARLSFEDAEAEV